jgi:hypothetical protein
MVFWGDRDNWVIGSARNYVSYSSIHNTSVRSKNLFIFIAPRRNSFWVSSRRSTCTHSVVFMLDWTKVTWKRHQSWWAFPGSENSFLWPVELLPPNHTGMTLSLLSRRAATRCHRACRSRTPVKTTEDLAKSIILVIPLFRDTVRSPELRIDI